MYLAQHPNRLSNTKDTLYVAKIVDGLPITQNKSEMTQKSNLAINFLNTKAVQDISVIYNNI